MLTDQNYFNDVLKRQVDFDTEYRIITPLSKELKWIHGIGKFSYDKEANPATMYGTIQDITERKNNENQLKQALYIFENTYDSIIVCDENVNIINVNNAFTKITKYSLEEVKGKNPKILKSGLHDNKFYKDMWNQIKSDGYWTGEVTNKNKLGKNYEELLTITAIKNENEEIVNYIGISTDISKRKMQERLLLQQVRSSAIGDMIENIAHQWRQPLSIISMIATSIQISLDTDEDENHRKDELYKSLETINENTQYLSKTIDGFRTYFKKDETDIDIYKLNEIFEKIKVLTKDNFSSVYVNYIENLLEEDCIIKTNENLFIQSLLNIYNNSIEAFIKNDIKQRYLFVNVTKSEKLIIIKVKDNAGGIKKENLEKIFDPYFTTKHKAQGTGLGLYMTRKIITNQLNGHIIIENIEFMHDNITYNGLQCEIKLKTE